MGHPHQAHDPHDHDDHDARHGDDDHGHDEHGPDHAAALEWPELARIAFVALAAAAVWFRLWEPLPRISLVGLIGIAVGGYPIFKEAWENIRERRMTMELSMTIALVAALLIGELFTALVITAFVLVAEVLEGLTVGRGRKAIRDLVDFLPRTVRVRRGGGIQEVAAAEVRAGDAVLIDPGARVPVDGTVTSGHSYVDQATITGESTPAEKGAGSAVYAGTINQSGVLEVRAERLGRDTSYGKIVEAVERAERSRAPVQKVADRYAGYLVYFALGCAVLTFLLTRSVRSTISVIIVAGACGIAAGTPLAVLGAIGRAAREGAIVKGGRYLEALWRVDAVAFDKTGTVTVGAPTVREIVPAPGVAAQDLLAAAAIAERRSEHPLGKAIVAEADRAGLAPAEPESFDYTPGRGVVARAGSDPGDEIVAGNRALLAGRGLVVAGGGGPPGAPAAADRADRHEARRQAASEVLVARGGRFLGAIWVGDAVRPEAARAVRALRQLNIGTVLLTGDGRAVAVAVAGELGMDDVRADLLPEEKMAAVREMVAAGRSVAMVGDGVNDAPALTAATVGVAMGSGTDVARESADIVLLGNDLSRFVETVRIARRCRDIIRFNFAGTLAVDAVGVGLAAFGYLNPLVAAFIHVASELTFILNSARLLPATARAAAVTAAPVAQAEPA
ncbi:MAG TPA: cation-translocating P-type ATPase [Thermoanaerobaculia bacterium]|nr:cation-translocating P-type ATPase [Thermoanaerobaculia bacterium]